jgi:hypothetical protein
MRTARRAALVAGLLAWAGAAAAQPAPDSLSPAATVSLLTMLPGDEVYSIFGHSAFRITDPASGLDKTYNFGTFDFEQPGFILRFARGRLDYILDTAPFAYEVDKYRWLERPIIEQRLDVDAATAEALYRRLETNALPENRAYRYQFFYDNCSTRLLDALDAALRDAGRPRVILPERRQTESFRDLIRPYAGGMPLLWAGMSSGLGLPADAVASTRERTFLPLELMRVFDASTVGGRPLVARRDTVFWVEGGGRPPRAFNWPAALGWLAFAAATAGTALSWRRARGRPALLVLDVVVLAFAGFAGTVVALLWLATEHGVTGPNLHLLWAWPTHLVAAVAVARGRRWRAYFLAAGAAGLVAAVGWALWPQGMPAAVLPVAALVALRCAARARVGPDGMVAGSADE